MNRDFGLGVQADYQVNGPFEKSTVLLRLPTKTAEPRDSLAHVSALLLFDESSDRPTLNGKVHVHYGAAPPVELHLAEVWVQLIQLSDEGVGPASDSAGLGDDSLQDPFTGSEPLSDIWFQAGS